MEQPNAVYELSKDHMTTSLVQTRDLHTLMDVLSLFSFAQIMVHDERTLSYQDLGNTVFISLLDDVSGEIALQSPASYLNLA